MSEKLSLLSSPIVKLTIITFLFICIQGTSCSYGDRTISFQNCMHWCGVRNCTNTTRLADFEAKRPWYLTFLQWECWDECDHYCMWHVVKLFQFNGQEIPQFHGKVSIWFVNNVQGGYFVTFYGFFKLVEINLLWFTLIPFLILCRKFS